ncbi:hypothetical protein HUU42_12470 [bacterium]|nr:hypothetical protein [bacterium]
MSEGINLKQLILLIQEHKNLSAHFCLDVGCVLPQADPKPLLKMINYCINYLRQLGNDDMQIDLDTHRWGYLLVLIIPTKLSELPPFNPEIHEQLKPFSATCSLLIEPSSYAKIEIKFHQSHA